MGRARHFRATQVYERLRRQLAAPRVAGTHEHEYRPWASALRAVPPAEVLTRTLPVQHGPAVTVRSLKRKKSDAGGKGLASLMKPQPLVYIEDELRKRFYRDHPWELARPRVVAEVDGMDARQWDWSKGLRQPGMQLSGER